MNGKGLGVANVGKVGDELEAVDNLTAGSTATFDTEAQDTAETALEVLLGQLVRWVALETGVRHPGHIWAGLEVTSEGEGVGSVPLGTEGESLDTEEELLGTEGVEAGTEVAEELDSNSDSIGDGTEGLPELEPVVTLGGLNHLGEALAVLAPVELAGIDDDATDGSTVTTNPLGGRVDDDISTVLDGADEVTAGAEGVVDNHGDTVLVGNVGNLLEVGDVVAGVANALNVDGLGLVVNDSGEVLGLVSRDEFGSDAEALKEDLELVVGTAVEVGGGNDVVTGVSKSGNGHKLSGHAGGGGNGSNTTLEGGDSLLEYIDGGVHDSGVDVAKLLEAEEAGTVSRVIENVALLYLLAISTFLRYVYESFLTLVA